MSETVIKILAEYSVEIVVSIVGLIFSAYVIPWMRQKKIYWIVEKLVEAAEKLKENAPADFDKHAYVTDELEARGIHPSRFVDAMIEAAVKKLDIEVGLATRKR